MARWRLDAGADGEPHPTPGALHLVFSDLGTSTGDGWNVYEELRAELVARGVPRAKIRFVHEARDDREKAELFAACRDGRVSVLIGSTEKMGVGANVQLRAAALHDLDCPWRPADMEQRMGRIERQGNANADISVYRYVTEGSFDAYLWQTLQRKAHFIGQVMRGRLDVREIEDVGEQALSYNEVKALATGNPLLLEQARVEAEVKRLERLERAHANNQTVLKRTADDAERRIDKTEERVAGLERAIAARVPMARGEFAAKIGTRSFEKRAEANDVLRETLQGMVRGPEGELRVGELCGFTILASRDRLGGGVELSLAGVPDSYIRLLPLELERALPVGRLEHRIMTLEAARDAAESEWKRLSDERGRANRELGKPFRQAAELERARTRLQQVEEQLGLLVTPQGAASETQEPEPVLDEKTSKWMQVGEELERRWNAECTGEVARVRGQAEAALARAERATQQQASRMDVHAGDRPKRPNVLVRAIAGTADYQTRVDDWAKERTALARRRRQLDGRVQVLREFARETVAGYPTRGTRLAEKLVKERERELAKRVEGFRKFCAEALTQLDRARSQGKSHKQESEQQLGR